MSAASLMKVLASATVLSVALAACSDDDDPVVPPIQTADVYVIHGVNGIDVGEEETLPVDVRVGTECVATNVTFGQISNVIEVDVGTYDVEVRMADATACSGTVVASLSSVQLSADQSVSLVAHLNAAGQPAVSRFNNDRSVAADTRVVARHTAAFGPVDVLLDDEVVFANLANGQEQTDVVTAGTYNVAVVPAGTDEIAFETDVPLQANVVYIAYAVGTPENDTFDVLLHTLTMQ